MNPSLFKSIKPQKISALIVDQIKDAIREGKLQPGDRLPSERQLAAQMGVSRPPIRDAIKELIFTGYLETRGNGNYIKSITGSLTPNLLKDEVSQSVRAFRELAELRELLESWAAGKAALNHTPEQIAHLGDIVHGMETATSRERITSLDLDFHRTVAEMVGNTLYLHQIISISGIMIPIISQYREKILLSDEQFRLLQKHHRDIYEAIRSGDPEKACKAMQTHIAITRNLDPVEGLAGEEDAI